jgi:outer membrane receptor for ferrienterochelin and colicin
MGYGSGSNTTISPDAIEEYRVIAGTPSAEYGKAGGFVTDTVLKSGTNQWHGSLFEYNRIQALAANSWLSNFNQTRRIT